MQQVVKAKYLVAILVTSSTAASSDLADALDLEFDTKHDKGSPNFRGEVWSAAHCRLESPADDFAELNERLSALLAKWPEDYETRIRRAGLVADVTLDIAVLTSKYTHTTSISGDLMAKIGTLKLPLRIVYYPTDFGEPAVS